MTAILYAGRRCQLWELDAKQIRDLYPRTEVQHMLAQYRPWYQPSAQAIEGIVARSQWMAQLTPRPEIEAVIVSSASGQPIGFVCMGAIDTLNLKAEISVGVFRAPGTRAVLEALHWVLAISFANVHKVVACVAPTNRAAVALLEGLGVPREAVLGAEVALPDGTRQDLWRYALLAPQWQAGTVRSVLERLAPLAV